MSAPPDNHHRSIYTNPFREEPTRVDLVTANIVSAIVGMSPDDRRELLMLLTANLFADIEIEEDRVIGPSDMSKLGADVIERLAASRLKKLQVASEQRRLLQAMKEGRMHDAPERRQ